MMRPRFTVRWLIAAVAVAGLAFGWLVLARRGREFGVRAEAFEEPRLAAKMDIRFWEGHRCDEGCPRTGPGGSGHETRLAKARDREAYYTRMIEKYRHAARYPWLSVGPDPTD